MDKKIDDGLLFRVLSDRKIEQIYRAALACLERTGVKLLNAEARELMAAAGARVEGERVRIPPAVVEQAVASSPRSFTLWDRTGSRPLELAPGRNYFGPGPTCTYFVDPENGQRRKARRGDPGLTARVADGLKNIDYVMSLALIDDVPPNLVPVYEFAEMVANTTKPVVAWAFRLEELVDIYEIGVAVAGSAEALRRRPFFAFFTCAQPPLVHMGKDVANVLWAVEHDLPVVYVGGGSIGGMAPITMAGTLVVALADTLAGLTLVQLKKPGAPVSLGSVTAPIDLRTGRPAYGGPELSLGCAAMADIARYLGLPYMGTGGASEAKVLDQQAAIESTVQVLFSGLSGATLVHDVGFLDCADIGSLEMLVMTDEIIGLMRRLLRGVEVNEDTLMLELIDQVGPGGEFLSTEETAWRGRQELWIPGLFDRDPWPRWEAAGGPVMADRTKARLRQLLASHQAPPLSQAVMGRIEAVLAGAEQRESTRKIA